MLSLGSFINAQKETIDEVLIGVLERLTPTPVKILWKYPVMGLCSYQQQILRTLIDAGCSLAKPGEFTQELF
jgi:tRNA U34 5-carboxymethylaminomethyl modifying GTPase MnmE/TrmE